MLASQRLTCHQVLKLDNGLMLVDFIKGFNYLLSGFKLIREPGLFRFVWIPLICNIVLFAAMLMFAGYGLHQFSAWIQHFLPHWLEWLKWVVWVLSFLFSAVLLIFISTFLVNLVAAPFNGILSERVLRHLNATDTIVPVSTFKSIPSAIWRQLQFLAYYSPRAVGYLLLFIVPIVQVIAAVLWFLFNSWVFTLQYLDYPMDLNGISIQQMKVKMREKRGLCLGFGSGVVLFSMIPFVNFLIVPVAVVGATALWANEFRRF
jgi:CysZ protein